MKSDKQIRLSDFFLFNDGKSQIFHVICIQISACKIMNKLIKSFGYAIKGIKSVFGSEANMKIHGFVGFVVVICGIIFKISINEWLLCLLCFGLVLSMELVNTAIETIVDLVSPDQNPLAGKAKDIAAGAVLISAIISATIGLIIFVPKGWALLFSVLN